MTSMPELVALFNGFGGIASLLVGSAEYLGTGGLGLISLTAIFLTLIIGGVTFSRAVLLLMVSCQKSYQVDKLLLKVKG